MRYNEEKCKNCMRRDFCKDGFVDCIVSDEVDITTDRDTDTVTTNSSPWHTGTPKEEGLYVCASANVDQDNKKQIGFAYWDGIAWYSKKIGRIIAWWGQKITPFEEIKGN